MNTRKQPDITLKKDSKYFSKGKDFLVLGIGVIAVAYLLNFTFGLVEFLPDNLPIVGNLDEAVMTGVLISVFRYFDIDIIKFFKRG